MSQSSLVESDSQIWERLLALKKVLHRVVEEIDDQIDELEEKLLRLLTDAKFYNSSVPLIKVLLELSMVSFDRQPKTVITCLQNVLTSSCFRNSH